MTAGQEGVGMGRRLVYDVAELDELEVGTVVRAHRNLVVDPGGVSIVVRQPRGWFGAWDWEVGIAPEEVVPCTVLCSE